MTRATPFLITLMFVLPSAGSAQALPGPGDRIRIRQVDGTVLTGTLDTWSEETIQLSVESAARRMEVPVSAIEALEISLGRQRRFGKYYALTLAATSMLGGIVGLTRASPSSFSSSRSAGYYRGRSGGGGLLVGYLVGIPLGVFIGSRVTEERWSPVAISGSAQAGPTIRPVIGSEVGLVSGQRIRVRAADGFRIEGVFSGFEGQDVLLSTTRVGQAQRVAVDQLQALWVRKRATGKGALIGAFTGGIFGIGAGLYVKEYVLYRAGVTAGDLAVVTVVGVGLGAAAGALIAYWVQGWSPVWP